MDRTGPWRPNLIPGIFLKTVIIHQPEFFGTKSHSSSCHLFKPRHYPNRSSTSVYLHGWSSHDAKIGRPPPLDSWTWLSTCSKSFVTFSMSWGFRSHHPRWIKKENNIPHRRIDTPNSKYPLVKLVQYSRDSFWGPSKGCISPEGRQYIHIKTSRDLQARY